MKEIDDYVAECRACCRSSGVSAQWADRLGDDLANALYAMYEASTESADRIDEFDSLLEILRKDVPIREKLTAVAAYLGLPPHI